MTNIHEEMRRKEQQAQAFRAFCAAHPTPAHELADAYREAHPESFADQPAGHLDADPPTPEQAALIEALEAGRVRAKLPPEVVQMGQHAQTINEVCRDLREAERLLRFSTWVKDEAGQWQPFSLDKAYGLLDSAAYRIAGLRAEESAARNR